MINKLLSHLPFNPGLLTQVSFYAKRLRKEESVRRLGFLMIALSMLLQVAIAMSPPEKSLAYSDMNLINGLRTRDDLVAAWQRPNGDIDDIYGHFGVTLEDIKNLPKNPNSSIRSNADNYWSVGRLSLTGFSNVDAAHKKAEVALDTGPTTVYMRPLRAWDIVNPTNTYKAWQGRKKSDGKVFWIIVDCGNYVQVDKFTSTNPPQLEIRKSVPGKPSQIKPGDKFKFRIEFRNKIKNSVAENAVLEDELDLTSFEVVSPQNLTIFGNKLRLELGDLAYSPTFRVFDITVKAKATLQPKQKICNEAILSASNASAVKSNVCSSSITTASTGPPGTMKSVKNLSQNLSGIQAVQAKVKGGDVLEYTLLTTNTQPTDKLNYVVEDYVGDLLDYAEIDMAYLSAQKGVFDKTGRKVIWANQTLKANSDTVKSFRIKMKNPIPSTNAPSALSTTFDCKISNQYGNELSLNVACPFVKSVERLPNTGPGTTVAIGFLVTSGAGYFFARSRLLAKELETVRREYAAGGGL